MSTAEILIRYLHFISIFAVVSVVVAEHLLVSKSMSRRQLQRVSRLDRIYGIAAVVVFVTGLLQWVSVGKPSMLYTKNWIFHLKLMTFIVVGLMSIYPTVFFLKNRKGDAEETVNVPKGIVWVLRLELMLLFSLPLLAVLIARGVGLKPE